MTQQEIGPVMLDIVGSVLQSDDRRRLAHPLTGGVILFSKNFKNINQLIELNKNIKKINEGILIAIDHEGGRVQRCREGFTRLPAMRQIGRLFDRDPVAAVAAAESIGYVLAAELRCVGVELSFAPVLDLDWGPSGVIGDRSFHRNPAVVLQLARALQRGLRRADMGAIGKHFPGHGAVAADSHVAVPVDLRPREAIEEDMLPYRQLVLDGVMPAHVIFPEVDSRPAGFSPVWHHILRDELGFSGAAFSDDLSMAGAGVAGDIVGRAQAAWSAGCDMLLVCNAPDAVDDLYQRWCPEPDPVRAARVAALRPSQPWTIDFSELGADDGYCQGVAWCQALREAVC